VLTPPADAVTRMAVRRHPVVLAVILSDLAARAMDIVAVADRGRRGNLDRRPFIRAQVCALDRVCAQGMAGRLGISETEGLARALQDGYLDDFTSSDLSCARLADTDLTGVRWSPSGTIWPPGTDVKAILNRSESAGPGSGVLVVTRRPML
jgi:hypothetical protein